MTWDMTIDVIKFIIPFLLLFIGFIIWRDQFLRTEKYKLAKELHYNIKLFSQKLTFLNEIIGSLTLQETIENEINSTKPINPKPDYQELFKDLSEAYCTVS